MFHTITGQFFPGGSEVKASASNVGDLGSIPGLGRFPGEGNGNPLQYSCLENLMDREACSPQGRKELDTTERLHFHLRTPPSWPKHLPKTPPLNTNTVAVMIPIYEWVGDINIQFTILQFSSVAQSCLTLCDPMDCIMPGLPIHRQILEFTQTHVCWVDDVIQPSHPLCSFILSLF